MAFTLGAVYGCHGSPGGVVGVHSQIDFNADIRPILNSQCTACHGGVSQEGGISFVFKEDALGRGNSGRRVVVPGRPDASELIARVTSDDPELRMPFGGDPLPPEQLALLRQWIAEGAQWLDPWAFVPPEAVQPPQVSDAQWPRGGIDRFVLARLDAEGLQPSEEAGKAALLRRVSLDLTGLPPTPAQIEAFAADTSVEAYERQVDRLLDSPAFGERWASVWLDLARYADSKGYEKDLARSAWPYRDWVIDALNANMPYDEFVIRQLAGDLLPERTMGDVIATAFHRMTPTNDEGGSDDEEYRIAALIDRVATTWIALNGVTMNCVQCHSHPYDPIRHEEFYSFYSFLNMTEDADMRPVEYPVLAVPTDASHRAESFALQEEARDLRRAIVDEARTLEAEESAWRRAPIVSAFSDVIAELEFQRSMLSFQRDALVDVEADEETDKRRQELAQRISSLNQQIEETREDSLPTALTIVDGDLMESGELASHMAYQLTATVGEGPLTALRIATPPLDPERSQHTPDDGYGVDRVRVRVLRADGQEEEIAIAAFAPGSIDGLVKRLERLRESESYRTIGEGSSANGAAAQAVPLDTIVRNALAPGLWAHKLFHPRWSVAMPATPLTLRAGDRIRVELVNAQMLGGRDGAPTYLRRVSLATSGNPEWTRLANDAGRMRRIARLNEIMDDLNSIDSVAVPVMSEQPSYERRATRVFERGNFLTKTGPPLVPDVPGIFPRLPADAPRNRLTLARWFFQPDQPLTARVAVNRFWEQLFGKGLVETLEDFGSVGTPPSHPELLDWMALRFQNQLDWDVKAMLREIVTSATYRQDATVKRELRDRDADNRLLARGPRQRLTAEMVRDQALAASGLLCAELGGPPVMPPQPEGLWKTPYSNETWIESEGCDRYRRAIYTFIKRSATYPSFLTFDATQHVVTTARRIPTNTPLQALVTLNDPVYHEAATALGRRMMEAGGDIDSALDYGARLVLSRNLSDTERGIVRGVYERATDSGLSESAQDAWTDVASVLLNVDAALVR